MESSLCHKEICSCNRIKTVFWGAYSFLNITDSVVFGNRISVTLTNCKADQAASLSVLISEKFVLNYKSTTKLSTIYLHILYLQGIILFLWQFLMWSRNFCLYDRKITKPFLGIAGLEKCITAAAMNAITALLQLVEFILQCKYDMKFIVLRSSDVNWLTIFL